MPNRSIVQSLWVGTRLSTMGRLAIQSFLAHGHEFHLYCFEPIEDAPAGAVLRDAREILPREKVFAYQTGWGKGSYSGGSNFFRYKLLLERGGWWVDTDVVCLQPFDFPAEHVIASEHDEPSSGRGVIAATNAIKQPAGSALMRWAWHVCRQRRPETIQWDEVGPRLLNESVNKLGWQDDMCAPEVFNPVPWFGWRALIDPALAPALGPQVHAVHLWHQMWRANGVDPDGRFPEPCLYEQLKRRFLTS